MEDIKHLEHQIHVLELQAQCEVGQEYYQGILDQIAALKQRVARLEKRWTPIRPYLVWSKN